MFSSKPIIFPIAFCSTLLTLPISLVLAQPTLMAQNPSPDVPFCFMESPNGQSINLEKICGAAAKNQPAPINRVATSRRQAMNYWGKWRRPNPSKPVNQTTTPNDNQ